MVPLRLEELESLSSHDRKSPQCHLFSASWELDGV